jgi:hypothetical protein
MDGERAMWHAGETVIAQAYDNPIPGYDTMNSINLRLIYIRLDCGNPFLVQNLISLSSTKEIISKPLSNVKERSI